MQFKWLIVLAVSACLLLSVEAQEKKVNIELVFKTNNQFPGREMMSFFNK
jgi:hypothetical protein